MKDHSLHAVSRPEKVEHVFITRRSICLVDDIVDETLARWSPASLRAVDALPPVPGPTALQMPCSQPFNTVEAPRQVNTIDDQRSATMLL